jgi:hypothetical protein
MYQKLIIREADMRVLDASRPEQRTTAKKSLTWDDVIRPDRMIICSDWPTTLRCNTAFRYKKGDGRECPREREKIKK